MKISLIIDSAASSVGQGKRTSFALRLRQHCQFQRSVPYIHTAYNPLFSGTKIPQHHEIVSINLMFIKLNTLWCSLIKYSVIQKDEIDFVSLYFKIRTSDKYDVNYI